jgi:hypothetical protein
MLRSCGGRDLAWWSSLGGVAALLALAGARPAVACTGFSGGGPIRGGAFEPSPAELAADREPPGPLQVGLELQRGSRPKLPGYEGYSSSCDHYSTLVLSLRGGTDDRTPAARLLYEIELRRPPEGQEGGASEAWVARELRFATGVWGAELPGPRDHSSYEPMTVREGWVPMQLELPGAPPPAAAAQPEPPEFRWTWEERREGLGAVLDFWLTVTPVDRAGRRGPPSWVHVSHPGLGAAGAPAPQPRALALEASGLFPPEETLRQLRGQGRLRFASSGQEGPHSEHFRQLAKGVRSWNRWPAQRPARRGGPAQDRSALRRSARRAAARRAARRGLAGRRRLARGGSARRGLGARGSARRAARGRARAHARATRRGLHRREHRAPARAAAARRGVRGTQRALVRAAEKTAVRWGRAPASGAPLAIAAAKGARASAQRLAVPAHCPS